MQAPLHNDLLPSRARSLLGVLGSVLPKRVTIFASSKGKHSSLSAMVYSARIKAT